MLTKAALPTYQSIAEVMAESQGAGLRLAGWTLGRAVLIFPGVAFVGVDPAQAAAGSLAASSAISALALTRFWYVARENGRRKDYPMKALLLVGGVAALGLGVYFATRKKAEAADPVYTQPAPINPEDVGMEPPEATPAPPVLAPPDEENVNVRTFDASKYRLQRGLGLVGRVRISRMPF